MRHQSLFLSRLALRRRPIVYWTVTALVTIATALAIGGLTARAEHAAARFGGLRPVVIVVRPVGEGDAIAAADVRIERRPRSFVPDGALDSPPVGQSVLSALYPGEVLLGDRLAPSGLHGVAARLPAGTVGLAVPGGRAGLRVELGDLVDVLATTGVVAAAPSPAPVVGGGGPAAPTSAPPTPGATGGDGATRIVASGAKVVDVSEETVTVAVRETEAPLVATALTQATITLALSSVG